MKAFPHFAKRFLLTSLLVFYTGLAFAQQAEVDLVGGRDAATPIAVVPFGGDKGAEIAAIVTADLARSGQFRPLPERDLGERPTATAEVNYPFWRTLGQDWLLVGRVIGDLSVQYELFDVANQTRVIGLIKTGPSTAMRDIAHQIADEVYEKVTGVRGAFWTRMAYVSVSGLGKSARYAIMVADADGHGARSVANSNAPLMSPAWSPDGRRLAYVSFESGNSAIYVQDLGSGQRERVAAFPGINSAPAFSPDGRRLAMTLSKSGNPEIYVMDLDSKSLSQVTRQSGIDTSATWSADGGSLYFTSDRGGRPQIYRASAGGGGATRVSFQGGYNADASVSADGRKIAMVQGGGNSYRIALMDSSLGGARWSTISPGSLDEKPSLSPNAAMVVYAARAGSGSALQVVSSDGRVRERLPAAGDVRDPAWGPYRERR
ncbi:Tol-Pal system beta propeller repeat protein TolB [Lysobacter pythonis]|uniref:Tol-Pal system protein TolB n=1 Tax=Solilutibacter pythonis TaxID=2483112 RepID=A0A3M2I4H6_9GAMM|nr:Tol-Pal system beta propeller repeat protein TolB [Lysobacter pythonis]RMH94132.1 Tol-Pal system beta propeller repeat protein TolB [Lysobacter pythonis]